MSFLPILTPADIFQAAQLIQQSYAPGAHARTPEDQRGLQQDLFNLQKKWEAWGLIVPFLEHDDHNVQFFGAHTAQVKITRDWESFPKEHAVDLKDLILDITGASILAGRSNVTLRKLFVSLCSLAMKLARGESSLWPDWILSTVTNFSSRGAPTEIIMDFLTIVAEEVMAVDPLSPNKWYMQQTLKQAIPLVVRAIDAALASLDASTTKRFESAMKCFEAWITDLPANDLTTLIPPLFGALNPASPSHFIPATTAFLTILSSSSFASRAPPRTLTEPLLLWLAQWGTPIIGEVIKEGAVDEVGNTLCKLLAGIGDHATDYLAENIACNDKVEPAFMPVSVSIPPSEMPTRGQLVQIFLRLLLSFTALPGYYGVDEDESEMTLGFWYLFQEALWNVDAPASEDGNRVDETREKDMWAVARAVYAELVSALRRKVKWPGPRNRWAKDQVDKFKVYRRDVGDTLINAYYILRDDMLAYYIGDLVDRFAKGEEQNEWEEIEATLHCIMSIQEPVPEESSEQLSRLFSPEIIGRLPTTGQHRVRQTALSLIGSYSSWFTSLSSSSNVLMGAIAYAAAALREPTLCMSAANSLRDLCDANRVALAPHIAAFGELHTGLVDMPDTENAMVLQSIASVIQALPAAEEISPIEAIVTPVVGKLVQALHSASQLPEEARVIAIQQLQTLTSVAKGLTRNGSPTLADDANPEVEEQMQRARDDPRALRLRDDMMNAIRAAVELWSSDAGVSDALSNFFKSVTALPADETLISLPPAPVLEVVCRAAQRQFTAVWLSLARMLVSQINRPPLRPSPLRVVPSPEALAIVREVVNIMLQTGLTFLGVPGAMEANPDIVQEFFDFMEKCAHHFVSVLYQLPPGSFDALITCAVTALSLQERYSLVSASKFLSTLITRTHANDDLMDAKATIAQHGFGIMRGVLIGFAGIAPRSAAPNLIDVLSILIMKYPAESKDWMTQVLFADDFIQSKAGPEAKDKFVRAVFGSARSFKRTRDAAQQFTLVARGLDESSFGYASLMM